MAYWFLRLKKKYMLYYIDQSIVESVKEKNENAIGFLQELGYAWQFGQCLVSASRSSFIELMKIDELKSQYYLIEKYAQGVHSLYESLDFFIVLVTNGAHVHSLQQYANKFVVVDIAEYHDIKQIHNNYLVCENVRDCEFYTLCTKQLLSAKLGSSYQLNILNGNGGGGSIVEVLQNYTDYSCLSICDSDMKYPLCKIGQTLEDVINYFKTQHGRRQWLYGLQVHELENLIPLYILEHARNSRLHKARMNKLKTIIRNINGNMFLKYFDLKKGFRDKLLLEINEKDNSFFSICNQILLCLGKKQKEINKIIAKGEASDLELVPGFGEDIFNDTLDYIKNNYIAPNLWILQDYQEHDLNNIANKVWSLGCAMQKRRL